MKRSFAHFVVVSIATFGALIPLAEAQAPDGEPLPTQPPAQSTFLEQPKPEPYSLKNVQLGMALEQFKMLRFPGAPPNAVPMCTCDPATHGMAEFSDPRLGGTTCRFMLRDHTARNWEHYLITTSTMAEVPAKDISFLFVNVDGHFRLYQISAMMPSQAFDELRLAFLQRYGPAFREEVRPIQNGFGAYFQNNVVQWNNGVSTIHLNRYSVDLDTSTIDFIHTDLHRIIQGRAESTPMPQTRDL